MRKGGDWRRYLTAFAHHELLHAAYTPRDLQKIAVLLRDLHVAFQDYNLFEDARIEYKGRAQFAFPLEWTLDELMEPAADARSYFFNLIQNRGANDSSLLTKEFAEDPNADRVYSYYFSHAVKADAFPDMVKLLQEWTAEFPPPPDHGSKGSLADLSIGAALMENPALLDELIAEACGDPKDQSPASGKGGIVPVTFGTDILSPAPVRDLRPDLQALVADRLQVLLKPGVRRELTNVPAKRIAARVFLRGEAAFYRRIVSSSRTWPGRVVLFLDCSGSMGLTTSGGCTVSDLGVALAAGLNDLAQKGRIKGQVVLHKGCGSEALCGLYSLPQPPAFFTRIPSDGAFEGLEAALRKTTAELKKADYIFCYTDGNLTDLSVDHKALARKGLHPIGLYCGDEEMAQNLEKYFRRFLIRPTLAQLLDSLLGLLGLSYRR